MKRKLSCLLSAVLTLSVAGCSSGGESTTAEMKDGSYTAEVSGHNGPMKVTVEIAEGKISAVNVTEQVETYGIGYGMPTTPVEAIPQSIVSSGSLGVDTIASNPITSAMAELPVQTLLQASNPVIKRNPSSDSFFHVQSTKKSGST